jgi:hypothetical protein
MEFLTKNLFIVAALWMLVYISDYTLTILSARLYASGVNRYVVYEGGIELTPLYKQDVARARGLSPRFLAILVLSGAIVILVGVIFGDEPALFEFFLGGWFLLEAAIHVRHFRNLTTYFYQRAGHGISGQLRIPMWLSYRTSAVEMLAYFGLYLGLYLLFGRVFFLGGALTCIALAVYHWLLGSRARKSSQQTSSSESR